MILTIVGLSRGTIESSAERTRGFGADIMIRPPNSSAIGLSSAPIPEKFIEVIEKQPHVVLATGVVMHQMAFLENIVGIDIAKFTKMSGGLDFLEGGPFQ